MATQKKKRKITTPKQSRVGRGDEDDSFGVSFNDLKKSPGGKARLDKSRKQVEARKKKNQANIDGAVKKSKSK